MYQQDSQQSNYQTPQPQAPQPPPAPTGSGDHKIEIDIYDNYQNFNGNPTSKATASSVPSGGFSSASQKEPIPGGYPDPEPPEEEPKEKKKVTSNGYHFDEQYSDPGASGMYSEDYGKDGYLNHMHINYDGGDDGESYFTGPDSDISFLDIITPMTFEGHL